MKSIITLLSLSIYLFSYSQDVCAKKKDGEKTIFNKCEIKNFRKQKRKAKKKRKHVQREDIVGKVEAKVYDAVKIASEEYLFLTVGQIPLFKNIDESLSSEEKEKLFYQELYKFFTDNFKYPKEAIKNKVSGAFSLKFTISSDGSVKNVETSNKKEMELLGNEIKRVVLALPNFKPGKQYNLPTNVVVTLPIKFNL